jgi:hypothetical protein
MIEVCNEGNSRIFKHFLQALQIHQGLKAVIHTWVHTVSTLILCAQILPMLPSLLSFFNNDPVLIPCDCTPRYVYTAWVLAVCIDICAVSLLCPNIQVYASARLLQIVGSKSGRQIWGNLQWRNVHFELQDSISSGSRHWTCGLSDEQTFVQRNVTFVSCYLLRHTVRTRRNIKAVSTRANSSFKTGRESTSETSFI